MQVVTVPNQDDNYAYLLINESTKHAAAIDPAQPDKMFAAAEKAGVTITTVWTTHKHDDHAMGNPEMKQRIPGIEVVGGAIDSVAGCTHQVQDGETFTYEGFTVKCLLCPGHTKGHISYYVTDPGTQKGVAFTGDCLFVGGAGKFFEGTGDDMYVSLYEKLGKLPGDTELYVGHEYTLSNYKFAAKLEPDNKELQSATASAEQKLDKGGYTVPSTIAQEKATNPFMRAHESKVQEATGLGTGKSTAQYLQRIRDMKDGK